MYFYSLYRGHYLKFSFPQAITFMLAGPIAAAYFGFIEVSALYLLILFVPEDPQHWLLFHGAYVLFGLAMLPILMKIRRYRRANFSDIRGRFQKCNSVWP